MKDYCWVLGGQSTYGAVNSESKNKLLCKNLKCANTTGSKFNQVSLVAEIQLPFDYTNKPPLHVSSNKSKSFYTQVMILYLLWRPLSFVTRLCPTQTQLSSCDQRSQRLSPAERKEGYMESFLSSACSRQHFQPHISSSYRMKWMTCLALNVSLMGQQVPIWVSSAGRLEQRREREKKTSYQEIGNWVRQGITCHSRSKLLCVFPQRRAPHYQLRLISQGVYCVKGNMI